MAETTDRPKLVGLIGSFNPPTLAHLDLLKKAMAAIGAERGLFLPANDEYVRRKMAKANESVVISAEARIAMLEAMCRVEQSLGISLVDMDAARTCTYESVLRVSEENPGYDVLLVIGATIIHIGRNEKDEVRNHIRCPCEPVGAREGVGGCGAVRRGAGRLRG